MGEVGQITSTPSRWSRRPTSTGAQSLRELDEERWEYLDPQAKLRGPFSSVRMQTWHEHGMLPDSLGVRHDQSAPFQKIKDLFHPPLLPFMSLPRSCNNLMKMCWEYVDPMAVTRGPFPNSRMMAWYDQRMLPDDLPVRYDLSLAFAPLKELFPPPLVPFKSTPQIPAMAPAGDCSQTECCHQGDGEGDEDVDDDEADAPAQLPAGRKRAARESSPVAPNMRISPFDVRFSQMRVRESFRDGRLLHETIQQIEARRCDVDADKASSACADSPNPCWLLEAPFPAIHILQTRCKLRDEQTGRPRLDAETGRQLYDPEDHWFTLDNRRLYCLQRVASALLPAQVYIDVVELPPGALSSGRHLRKFRTLDRGRSIHIGARDETLTRWSWREAAGLCETGDQNSEPDAESRDVQIRRRPRGSDRCDSRYWQQQQRRDPERRVDVAAPVAPTDPQPRSRWLFSGICRRRWASTGVHEPLPSRRDVSET